ncbi:MAG: hypothetical protein J6J24_05485 [Clostridia bacterium]|nr:hypothetical protein [Clostridia bacterium]
MKVQSFNKIIIVSLCDKHSKKISKLLSEKLGVIFCDAKELMEYELIDRKAMEQLCSTEYLQAAEKRVIKHISSFENIVVYISYDYFAHHYELLKEKALTIFLSFSRAFAKENSDALSIISFQSRTKRLEELADLSVNIKKTEEEFVCNKIIDQIGGLL